LQIASGQKKVETYTVSTSAKNAHYDVAHPCTTSAASCSKQTRSFSGTEAEIPIHKPPFAQKHDGTDNVSGHSALFASPVKIISSPFIGFGSILLNPYSKGYYS
jgi:hypothetical protein